MYILLRKHRFTALNRSLAILAWGMLAFIAYATLSPIKDRPTLPTSPTYEHLFAFAVLGMLFSLAYPRRILFTGLLVIGSGIALEAAQIFLPSRHARLQDLAEKVIGGAAGIALGVLIVWLIAFAYRRRAIRDGQ